MATLYDSGVGHWVKPAPIMDFGQTLRPGDRSNAVATMQKLLADYGYGVEVNGEYDVVTRDVVAAFQRHFRPERVDGVFDASTRSTLQELLANRGRDADHRGARSHHDEPGRFRSCFLIQLDFALALDGDAGRPHALARQSVGRPLRRNRKVAGEESPGSVDKRCRITSGGCEPRDSATENRPPLSPSGEDGKGETVR